MIIVEGIFVILAIVILIVLAAIGYIIYVLYEVYNGLPTTNCSEFFQKSGLVGEENGPQCQPGTELYGGVCYKDVWTAQGGEKTGLCSVWYGPPILDVILNCSIGIQDIPNIGDPCPMLGEGWHKTTTCTCQLRGEITAIPLYCQDEGIPRICKEGWDFLDSICYFPACPSNLRRTAVCTCAAK